MGRIVSAIVPAYNEEDVISYTIKAIRDVEEIDKVYIIDDGSKDHTYQRASSIEGDIVVLKNSKNSGKGKALMLGVQEAIRTSDILVFLDADLGTSSIEARKLIAPILKNEADVVIARFPRAKTKGGFGIVKALAKYGVYIRTGKKIKTALSGQRAFKSEVLRDFKCYDTGFGIEVGMIIDIMKKGYSVKEVDVEMTHKETGRDLKGFIHRGKQFVHIFKVIIKRSTP